MTKHELLEELAGRLDEAREALRAAPGSDMALVRKLELESVMGMVTRLRRIHSVTYDEILVDLFNRVVAPGQEVVYLQSKGAVAMRGEVEARAYLGDNDYALVKIKGLDEPVPVAFVFHVQDPAVTTQEAKE